MKHLDELSTRLGFRLYLACINSDRLDVEELLNNPKVRAAAEDIINHYKEMNHVEQTRPVPTREEPELSTANERTEAPYG